MALNRKLAYIDLGQKKTIVKEIPYEWRRKFLGGRGISTYLLFRHLPKGSDPLGPGNVVIISTGVLGGTGFGPFECTGITSKSPLTGLSTFSPVTGHFAGEMRWAGFDHLVITGKSRHPVYLYIHDGKIDFKTAKNLKGKSISETLGNIRKDLLDEDVRALVVGPAGENRVCFADVSTDCGHRAGRTGMGAVLGSKNIKAVVCRGARDVLVKRPVDLLAYQKEIFDRLLPIIHLPHAPSTFEKNEVSIRDMSVNSFQGADLDSEMALRHLIAESGSDLFSTRCILEWVLRLFQAGIITQKKIRGIPLSRNNIATHMEVVNRITANKGIGTILSLGPLGASKKLGKESLSCFPSVIELIQMHTEAVADPLTPAQRNISFPKVNNNAHEKSYPIKTTGMRVTDRWKSGSIDRRAMGKMPGRKASEMVANCLGFNGFHVPEDILGMPLFSVYEKLLDLVTGLRVKKNDLAEIAHRCYATERLLNLRESSIHGRPASITEAFDVPVGLRMTKSCWDGLELKTFQRLVSRYYKGKGWDRKSMVKLSFFKNLGIEDLWVLLK